MQGKVKWFSVEKGYGFIVGEDGVERFFSVRDVEGADLPRSGYIVSFEHQDGNKGPRASKVKIIETRDDRVVCSHCGKQMIPRLITYQGEIKESVCPFCGGIYKDFRRCFIATAVYGDYSAPEVLILRRFREQYLASNILGRIFIRFYYSVSPVIARKLERNKKLRLYMKNVLDKVVERLNKNIKRNYRD